MKVHYLVAVEMNVDFGDAVADADAVAVVVGGGVVGKIMLTDLLDRNPHSHFYFVVSKVL